MRPDFRIAITSLHKMIVTPLTSKHRWFVLCDSDNISDSTTVMFALENLESISVLSSRTHLIWFAATQGRLGVGDDPRYLKGTCFDPFPFPDSSDAVKARRRDCGERSDAFRKDRPSAQDRTNVGEGK